jgi:hypothetical protein
MDLSDTSDILGENKGLIILQLIIVVLACGIIALLFSEKGNLNTLDQKMNAFKCPTCPQCPDCKCEANEGCPDCVCPKNNKCPSCPKCPVAPSCPECKTMTPEDIADAIFPGRNKGITSHGQYFPLDGLGEASVEPAYSPVTNLMPNYVGGDGVPAAISFADQKILNAKDLSVKKQPIATTQGVFTQSKDKPLHDSLQPSNVAKTGGTPTLPKPAKPTKPAKPAKPAKPEKEEPKPAPKGNILSEFEGKISSLF